MDYQKQALDFLKEADALCKIEFIGKMIDDAWKETELRNCYQVTLSTPKGSYSFKFWDSLRNTEITGMTIEDYAKRKYRCEYRYLTWNEQNKARRELKLKKVEAKPSEYDVLSCLTTYDVGGFSDFCADFGYDTDSISALKIYMGVQEEYHNLQKIFTQDQLERLSSVQ